MTGLRGVGKSSLLRLIKEYQCGISSAQIIYINFDDLDFSSLCEGQKLYDFIMAQKTGKRTYVFLDEVERCTEIVHVLTRLYEMHGLDITTLASFSLEEALCREMSGKYVTIEVFPLSFAEYSQEFPEIPPEELFSSYLERGGYPRFAEKQKREVYVYLNPVYQAILANDIMAENPSFSEYLLEKVLHYLSSCIGNPISSQKMANVLHGFESTKEEIDSYFMALCRCGLFQKVSHANSHPRYYVSDLGFQRLLYSSRDKNVGYTLENLVFLELILILFKNNQLNGRLSLFLSRRRSPESLVDSGGRQR